MALEKDLELLDDYLSNRLSGEDKIAFEKKLETDPELSREYKIQHALTEGIKNARVAELKSMLNNIPVAPIGGQASVFTKIGTVAVVAGIVATGLYFYFSGESTPTEPGTTIEQPENIPAPDPTEPTVTTDESHTAEPETVTEAPAVKAPEKVAEKSTTESKPKKPALEVYDPTKEEAEAANRAFEREQLEIISKAFVTSSIEVETETSDKKYMSHYVFKNGKLILYGGFEQHLYEILEFISGEKRTVVLFHHENYYLLDINKTTPTPLSPIKDKALLKKLKEYRSN